MKRCEVCGKNSTIGIDSTHNYGGGWSMRGQRTRKVWKANLQTVRILKKGRKVQMTLCTTCVRTEKAKVNAPHIARKAKAALAA